ncbi:protein disulfide-isomerase A3-like [Babylonia areolata]|uniref:protein disulfide-isomerase A3-like n=1 Tax=Babylonia areolata TaxID=304850 RepID=UPI003FD3A890
MLSLRAVLVVVVVVVVVVVSDGAEASSVLVFKDKDFQAKVEQHELILVEFYAPWCGHCKKLAPEYEKAAGRLLKNDPPVPLAKVDCVAEEKTCDRFSITGYPGLKVFKNGKLDHDYKGPREADAIVQTMAQMAGPTSKLLKTVQDFTQFRNRQGASIVGFFTKSKGYMAKTFQQVADEYGDLRFAHTTSLDILNHTKYKDAIVVFRPKEMESKFEKSALRFDGDLSVQTLKVYIDTHRFGLCGHRNSLNADKFKKPLFVAFYDVDFIRNPRGTNYWRNRIMKVASQIQEMRMVQFAVSNRDEHSQEMEDCGLAGIIGDKPVVCAYDEFHRKFKMEDEFSIENFDKFVRAVLNQEVDPYIKSEPVPSASDHPVKKVVGRTFNSVVNDKTKDVLIEFYAPWCTHCQELEPKYKRVAELLKGEPSIVIAKMDATSNDAPTPYEIKGFPAIYFAPKDAKHKPIRYQGPREVKDMVQFVAEEATEDLVGFDRHGNRRQEGHSKTDL